MFFWILRDSRVTSVLIGSSKIDQIDDALQSLKIEEFGLFEFDKLDNILND